MSPERGDPARLAAAHAAVHAVARASGSSFVPALALLPRERREAMLVVYAWCRQSDDIADGDLPLAEKRAALDRWRADLDLAFKRDRDGIADLTTYALAAMLDRFPIPQQHFLDLLAGVEMDLTRTRYATFAELREYAYRVASVVGLMSIEVFGATGAAARAYAIDLGIALQLTNILRDVSADLDRGRVYLPEEDFARHGIAVADLVARRDTPALRRAIAETARRAHGYFASAAAAYPAAERRALAPAEAMAAVYRRLLDRIERGGFDLFGPRPRVAAATKAWLALGALLRSRLPWSGAPR